LQDSGYLMKEASPVATHKRQRVVLQLQLHYQQPSGVDACRAPDNPHQQIIKRLLALEGDTIIEDAKTQTWTEVPQVCSAVCSRLADSTDDISDMQVVRCGSAEYAF
jgi:hypothetical protein